MHQKGPSEVISEGLFGLASERMGTRWQAASCVGPLGDSPVCVPSRSAAAGTPPVHIGALKPDKGPAVALYTSTPTACRCHARTVRK